jgi:8-oxo-dGTP diphosphatase
MSAEPRIREAVRALVIDELDRILLVRFEFPNATRWALPGGGINPGESDVVALQRELIEELGLTDVVVGPHLWNRTHIIPMFGGEFDGQRERVYEVRVPSSFAPQPALSWEQLNAEYVFELRWWTLSELEHADIVTAPRELASIVGVILESGPPFEPLTVDV